MLLLEQRTSTCEQSPDLANTSEPMSKAKTKNLDLASIPPPTVVLRLKRKSSMLSSAKAELY